MADSLYLEVGSASIVLVRGDITEQDTEAIVNAANSGLLGGGGVDGAIHRAGGPAILEECKKIRAQQGSCPTGDAVITTGGRLRAKKVIHTVGPIWHGGAQQEDRLLANAYRNSLQLAAKHHLTTVAFPSISTGVYGFPIDRASRIAFETVCDFLSKQSIVREVRFVVFSEHDFDVYAPLFPSDPNEMNNYS